MERADAPARVRDVLFDARIDPLGPVATDELNRAALFLGQGLEKEIEDGFAVAIVDPDHFARVVVDDDRHVLVPLAERRLIHTDAHQPRQAPLFGFGIEVLEGACHAPPDCSVNVK